MLWRFLPVRRLYTWPDVYKRQDYVIIDTPPLGSVIDGAIVAGSCDGAILVIESGVISYRFAQNVKDQLERSNCPVLGAVLKMCIRDSCNREGKVNPAVLVSAREAGADRIYKAGGAQAIAAMAFGTESIPKAVSYTHLDVYKRQGCC